ncbi:transposase [Paraburkholderia sp. JPY419]
MSVMRGIDEMQDSLLTTVKLDDFVPADHPLRPIRLLVNDALKRLNGLFSVIYAGSGRASIAPEKLLRALLLQVLLGAQRAHADGADALQPAVPLVRRTGDRAPCGTTRCSRRNRDRLLEHEVVEAFFTEVMSLTDQRGLLSGEHFSVDGTLIQAWASHRSFRAKDGSDNGPPASGGDNADTDWKGKRRRNDTHESSRDTDVRVLKRTSPATLCYHGHILMANRSGLLIVAVVSHARAVARGALRHADQQDPARQNAFSVHQGLGQRSTVVAGCLLPFTAAALCKRIDGGIAPCRAARRNPCKARLRVASAVATDGVDCHVSGNLVEQIRQHFAIAFVLMSHQCSADLSGVRVHRPMHLAPGATLGPAMLAQLPLAFAIDLQSGAVEHEVQGFFGTLRRRRYLEGLRATAQRCVVRHGQAWEGKFAQTLSEALQCAQRQMKDLLEFEQPLHERIRIDGRSAPGAYLEFRCCSEKIGGNPHRYIPSSDEPRVALRPVLDAALALGLGLRVGSILRIFPAKIEDVRGNPNR